MKIAKAPIPINRLAEFYELLGEMFDAQGLYFGLRKRGEDAGFALQNSKELERQVKKILRGGWNQATLFDPEPATPAPTLAQALTWAEMTQAQSNAGRYARALAEEIRRLERREKDLEAELVRAKELEF